MIDLTLQSYVNWYVKPVMRIKNAYGYRVCLKYADGTEKTQQKSGFMTKKEAEKAREKTIAELYGGNYIVYTGVLVKDFMQFWLETDIRKRVGSEETCYTYGGVLKNHIIPAIGNKRMVDVNAGDIQKLYNSKAEYSVSVANLVKSVIGGRLGMR